MAASTVVVLGLGGVGSNCVEALARGGVGRLVVVDDDVVQESNINRQAIAFFSTVGRKKTDVMRAMIADINPSAQVESHDRFVLAADAPSLLDELCADADYVVDAIDTVSTKLALAQEAERRGIRLVSGIRAAQQAAPRMLPVRRRLRYRELPALPHHAQGGARTQARHRAFARAVLVRTARGRGHARWRRAPRTVEPGHRVVRAAHHGSDDAPATCCARWPA